MSRQSLGRLRARLQSVPAPGSRGPAEGMDEQGPSEINRAVLLATQSDRGEINRRGRRGWVGMRKSAVSVRSGAGMPAHMAGESSSAGERRCKEKKGTV